MRSPDWLPPRPAEDTPGAAGARPAPEPPLAPGGAEPPPAWRRLGGLVVALGLLALKFGKVALLALKGGKVATTSLSMLVSIGAYALIWGWRFAVGFVLLLFVHEMGHVIALRREGVRPTGMLFVPFLGAAVGARSLGGSAIAEARVGLAGPVLGSLGAAAVMVAGFASDSDFLLALAFTAYFLNLFNLLPVVPFDGGRAMAAMAPWMWFVGLGAGTLYGALDRLRGDGLIEERGEEVVGGRRRRHYALTGDGRAAVLAEAARLRAAAAVVESAPAGTLAEARA